ARAPIDVLVRVNPIGDFSEVAGPDILPIEKNGIFDRASDVLDIGPGLDLGNIRAHVASASPARCSTLAGWAKRVASAGLGSTPPPARLPTLLFARLTRSPPLIRIVACHAASAHWSRVYPSLKENS